MNFLTKVFELLFTRHWVALLLSLVLGVKLYTVLPIVLLINISTLSANTNMIIGCIECVIITYLAICLIDYMIEKGRQRLDNYKDQKKRQKSLEADRIKQIEKWKSEIDGWNDYEYSVVMWLLRHENKVPFVQPREEIFERYMYSEEILDRAEYHGEGRKWINYIGDEKESMTIKNGFQFLLKPDVYTWLKYILETTGSLSHFERYEIELEQ
ncbi:hypothetical protein [Lactobacillus equicursoris]|jgi:hypothetical protein|uniref:hypothetical protein n=1 Tax=Lactobacillus equicursoris TaxID=420645 RepID=UPI0039939388